MTSDAQELELRAPIVNMRFYRGATRPITVTADISGTPIDLTGATAEMEILDAERNLLMTLETGAGIVLSAPLDGEMIISPESVGTASLPLSNVLRYCLIVTLADTSVWPLFRGIITVTEKETA